MATSPATSAANVPGAGKESTSVALFFPRKLRLSLRMVTSVVSSTVTLPRRRTAICACFRKPASARAEGRRCFLSAFKGAETIDRLAEIVSGAGSCPSLTGLRLWGERSGSRSGSRRIILREAAQSAAPWFFQFYANGAFTAAWLEGRSARSLAPATRSRLARRGSAATPAVAV
jgi:hypothetical protein